MKNENYETMNVEGGRHVKMWTRGVPVEDEAKKQLENIARMPFVHSHLAVMPDVHVGMGATVGSVIATQGRDHSRGGRCRHRLRHDGRADVAQGERSAGVAGGAARRASSAPCRTVRSTTAAATTRRRWGAAPDTVLARWTGAERTVRRAITEKHPKLAAQGTARSSWARSVAATTSSRSVSTRSRRCG